MTATTSPTTGHRHIRWRWVVLIVVVVVVAWLAWCALLALRAAHQLQRAQAAVTQVRNEVTTADLANNTAAPSLRLAAVQLAAAHRNLDSGWLVPLHVVPVVGRQLRAADALSGAASQVTEAGRTALEQVHALLSAPHQTPGERTVVVGRLATTLGTLRQRIDHVQLGSATGLISTLATKRQTFVTDVAKVRSAVDRGSSAAAAANDLLHGPRTYLVFTANNAEMRAGSGTFLEVGTLGTNNGELTIGSFVPTSSLVSPTPLAPVTGDLAARWGPSRPSNDYRDLGLSPQFPANASLAAAMWQTQRGQPVDGVLVIDVATLRDLLTVTGPITQGGTTLDAATVEPFLLRDQYIGVATDASNQARHEALGGLAGATFTALQQGGLSLPKLATALADAANGRNLLAWSGDPAVEADWQSAGVGGQLQADDLLLGTINNGANKLDPYQDVRTTLHIRPGHTTHVQVTTTLTNDAPADLPPYANGDGGPSPGIYSGALALDVPRRAGHITVRGGLEVVSAGSDGPSDVLATTVRVLAHASVTVTWSFVLDGAHGDLRVVPSARIPPVTWTVDSPGPGRQFTDASSHTVAW